MKQAIAEKIVREIVNRLQFLVNVGLDYLSLDRSADTLSGGEAQRIRLASQIGSGLTGVMYVLDEPSIGLHQRDNARLLDTLKRLRDIGNTVIVVEHDEEAIMSADHVVDMGLGAGEHGGRVVAQGTPREIARASRIAHRPVPERPAPHRGAGAAPPRRTRSGSSTISGATGNNLKNITVEHPGRSLRLRDRRVGLGQVDARQRHALQRGRAPALRQRRRAGAARGDHRARALRQGRERRPEPDRPHAALQSRDLHRALHADPRALRRRAGGARARLRRRAASRST